MNILIIGCGYIGTALGKLLTSSGHRVWGLRRDPRTLPEEFIPIKCDLANLDKLKFDFKPDYVFFMPSADKRDLETYKSTYLIGAENLIKCLNFNKALPKRLFYISSTSVYTQDNGEIVDESTKLENLNPYASLLVAAEDVIRQQQIPYTIVRFSGIYGPGRKYLINQIKDGKIKRSLNPVYVNNIHQEDCAGILQFLMSKPNPRNLYIGVDDEPSYKNSVIEWICKQYQYKLPDILEEYHLTEKLMRSNKRCSNQLIVSEGYRFIYPNFREGYAVN